MAYNYNNNYNGNRNYRNNNYRNNNYRNNNRPQYNNQNRNNNQEELNLDLRKYKKPNLRITDLIGNVYMIDGNFTSEFATEVIATQKKINNINNKKDDSDKFVQLFQLLKDWCLKFINLNTEGKKYTADDVQAGFNDYWCLLDLFKNVGKLIESEMTQGIENLGQ